jgi:hypothetical protein
MPVIELEAGVASRARRATRSRATFVALACAASACGSGADSADRAGSASGAPVGQVTPPGSDVWLATLTAGPNGMPTIGEPTNVTGRAGYDNQPHFVPDGSGFWYTAVDEHDGQADIWRYDFQPGMVTRVTASSPESEYSATPLPDGSGISVVRVEADSTQRLWRFDADGSDGAVLLEDVAPVGYHAWADTRTIVMFVLGTPATLRRADLSSGAVETIAEDIGRSIQPVPGATAVSFIQNRGDDPPDVMLLGADAPEPEHLVAAVEGGEFHAWTPRGTLLMSSGSTVYAWAPGRDGWTSVADFSDRRLLVTRLAVSPDGTQIALVGEVSF